MKRNRIGIVLGTGLLVLGISLLAYYSISRSIHPAWSPGDLLNKAADAEHIDGHEFVIMDAGEQVLSKMSRAVTPGDELITDKGRRYKVKAVDGFSAKAEFIGMDRELLALIEEYEHKAVPVAGQNNNWQGRPIAVYHTHSAESYVPTDGTESKPYKGGIFDVGDVFAAELEKKGVKVAHSKEAHEPRDSNAYYRSRRTAVDLMKENPAALIDVHRDGIPDPDYYIKDISGKEATQIRLVVGRQNPKMQSNMEFAKRLMAQANKVHPGIVKEIFVAKGNYNQDLMSTATLLEVGTHTNSKEAAQEGAALFADALPGILGVGGTTAPGAGDYGATGQSPAGWKTLAWIIGVALLGGGAFLLISSGNWQNAKKRLGSYWGREMAGFMGPLKKKIQTPKGDVEQTYSEEANQAAKENREKVRND